MPSRASSETNSRADARQRSASRSKPARIAAVVSAFDAARPCGDPLRDSAVSAATAAPRVVGGDGDQPDLGGLVGAELLAGQEVPAGRTRGHLRQQRQRDDRRRHADAGLGQRERARRARDDDVAGADEAHAAGAHVAVDRARSPASGSSRMARSRSSSRGPGPTATSPGSRPAASARSAPAQNVLPVWASTTTRTAGLGGGVAQALLQLRRPARWTARCGCAASPA